MINDIGFGVRNGYVKDGMVKWVHEGLSYPIIAYTKQHEKIRSFFQKQGGNFNFEKNVEFLEYFGFTLRFRTY